MMTNEPLQSRIQALVSVVAPFSVTTIHRGEDDLDLLVNVFFVPAELVDSVEDTVISLNGLFGEMQFTPIVRSEETTLRYYPKIGLAAAEAKAAASGEMQALGVGWLQIAAQVSRCATAQMQAANEELALAA